MNLLNKEYNYTACKTTQEILADLISLRSLDSRIEKLLYFIIFLTVASWAVFFIGLFSYFESEDYRLVLASGAIAIIFSIIWSLLKRKDLENERYESCISLLELLSEDIASQQKIRINIKFGDLYSKKFENKTSATNFLYFLPWLKLEGRFVDKTKFRLSGVLKARKRIKKNRRGKVKTKIKFKGHALNLTLVPPVEKSLRLRELSRDAKKAVYVPKAYCKLRKFTVTTKKIVIGFTSLNLIKQTPAKDKFYKNEMKSNNSEIIMKMFLSGFNIINLSEKLSKPKP